MIMIKNSTIDSSRILIFRFDTFQFQSAPYITITHSTRIWTEVSSIFLTTLNKNFDDLCLHNIGFFLFTHITLKNSMEKLGHPVYMYVGNSKQLGIRTLWFIRANRDRSKVGTWLRINEWRLDSPRKQFIERSRYFYPRIRSPTCSFAFRSINCPRFMFILHRLNEFSMLDRI